MKRDDNHFQQLIERLRSGDVTVSEELRRMLEDYLRFPVRRALQTRKGDAELVRCIFAEVEHLMPNADNESPAWGADVARQIARNLSIRLVKQLRETHAVPGFLETVRA